MDALLGTHARHGRIAAWCEPNPARATFYDSRLATAGAAPVPTYKPDALEQMIAAEKIDAVIVTAPDFAHADLASRALNAGVDVVLEKPLATSAEGCVQIASSLERSPGSLTVTFNYRYAACHSELKRLVTSGAIGTVTAVHFEWMLDTVHGADYFRRWHRDKTKSGGLLIQKASHHFDLVNWWLDDAPETVYARGGLKFYGDAAGAPDPSIVRPKRGTPGKPGGPRSDAAADPFLLDLRGDQTTRSLYLEGEAHDGYLRDQDVFGPGITIEDTMSVMVGYRRGATLTYSLVAYAPWEGFRVAVTGTRGRLELDVVERAVAPPGPDAGARLPGQRLTLQNLWHEAHHIPLPHTGGPHGGGEALLLDQVFAHTSDDALGRRAGLTDGLRATAVGLAANRSMDTGMPVDVDTLTIGEI